ncbi:MAG: prepilin-type N-terminal cleavage/methylation domain-containing protein [Clostridiales bacterium]|nr:prepilin-type N-terminal cleavage/methylation domain-containing protein [Clostridiales bacterium]
MKKEMNNKGFSLVELIIVIAIMVILIAVLAPQYLRYVEKARVSSDQNTIVEYINAMQTVAADPDISLDDSKTYTVSISPSSKPDYIVTSGDLSTILTTNGILDSNTLATSKVQSTAYKNSGGVYTLDYDTSLKMWTVTVTAGQVDMSGAVITTP